LHNVYRREGNIMAFDLDTDNIKKVMTKKKNSNLPVNETKNEKRITCSYTLEPSVKEGLVIKLARMQGYSNTSKFLNDLLKQNFEKRKHNIEHNVDYNVKKHCKYIVD
jgi:hypothetical protein